MADGLVETVHAQSAARGNRLRVNRSSLRWHLRWLTLGTLAPIVLVAAGGAGWVAQRERQAFERGAQYRVLALSTAVDAQVASSIKTLQALAASERLDKDDVAGFDADARRVRASQPDWLAVNLALPNGRQLTTTSRPFGAELPDVAERDSFNRVLRTAAPVVGNVALGPFERQHAFGVRVPVLRDGVVRYVVTAVVRPASIHQLLAAQRLPDDWVGVVLDANTRIVARTLDPAESVGKYASDSLRAAVARAPEGWFHGTTLENFDVYTAYHRSPASGWTVAMAIPAEIIFGIATRAVAVVALAALLAIGGAVVLAHVLGRRITTPIAAFAATARALPRGEPASPPPSTSISELANLGAALEQAVTAIRANAALQRQLAAVADNATVALFMTDDRQHCTFMNPAAERMTGYTLEEVRGKPLHDFIHHTRPDGRPFPISACPIDRAFPENDRQQGEDVFVHSSGRFYPVAYTASPIREDDRAIGTIIEVRDITAEKAAEATRLHLLEREQRARAQAEAANRAKDEFLAMLGHELRNPLSAIRQASFILDSTASADYAEQAKRIIDRQVTHLTRLVDDLLDAARVATGKIVLTRSNINLADLVRRVVDTMRAAGTTSRHRVVVDAIDVGIEGDPTRLEQVLNNLISNAVRYTPAGGTITVTAKPSGADALLVVSDTGIGMSRELLSRAFDLFTQGERTLERSQGGLGIGLTLVRRLIELHGGTVEAASEGPDRGSTFTVRLPGASLPAPVTPARLDSVATTSRRVLIIEDNEDARRMLRLALEQEGHAVDERADGVSGLDAAIELAPEVLIVDIGLPGITGYEVARRVRAHARVRKPLLIALTGYGQPEDERQAHAAGFDRYFVKPADMEALLRAVAHAERRAARRNAVS